MTKAKLSLMMFLQYMMLPVWLLPLLPYINTLDGGTDWMFAFGILTGVGTFASPFVCMFADRFFNSERVLAACNLVTAVLLGAAYFTASLPVLFVLLLAALVAYMPTWSVTSAIAMEHSSPVSFPRYRTLGSIGWVVSGAFSVAAAKWFGVGDFDLSRRIFAVGAALSAVGAVFALCLPKTAPRAMNTPLSVADVLGLKAFSLFRDPSLAQNVGQVAEIVFLLLIPLAVRRFGYRAAFASGFVFLALRYALFFAAAKSGWEAGVFGGILSHGFIFGLVVVVGQMYVGERAPQELRNQAQGLAILLTSGLGLFVSNAVMHPIVAASVRADGHHDWTVPFAVAFVVSVLLAVAAALFFRPKR